MRAVSIAAMVLALSGCALFGGKRQGSYAMVAPPSQTQAMVADSLVELVKLYPPAISRVSIDPKGAGDAFGLALADGLRKRGYAVVEGTGKGDADPSALPLRYVVDEPMPGFYRVMLRVGDQSLSRGYAVTVAGVSPSAGWAVNLSGASPELVARAMRPDLPELPGEAEQLQANVATIDGGPAAPIARPAVVASFPVRRTVPAGASTRGRGSRPGTVTSSWRVQFAAFQTERVARQHWQALVRRQPALAAVSPRFTRSWGMTLIQAGPYRNVASAKRVCGGLRAACIVVKA